MRDNVPMTTRASTKTNGKTLYNGIRSPRRGRVDGAKTRRVNASEKVDDDVVSSPARRTGNLLPDLETTPPPTTAAAATASDDEEGGVADEEELRLAVDGINIGAVAGTGGGTGAPKRDIKLREIVQSLARVDDARGEDRSLLRNFLYEVSSSAKKLVQRVDFVFGSAVRVALLVTSPFQRLPDVLYTNDERLRALLSAPNDESDVHVHQSIKKLKEQVNGLRKEVDTMNKVEQERAAAKRREDALRRENESLKIKLRHANKLLEEHVPPVNVDYASLFDDIVVGTTSTSSP